MPLTRRLFLRTSCAGALLLGSAAYLARPLADAPSSAAPRRRFLTPLDATIVAALVPVILGVTPDSAQLAQMLDGVDRAITVLPLATQGEVRELFDVLGNAWGRRFVAGVVAPWAQAPADALSAFLDSWRLSPLAPLRSGYQALHALVNAAWYGNPLNQPAIGYAIPAYARSLIA